MDIKISEELYEAGPMLSDTLTLQALLNRYTRGDSDDAEKAYGC